MYDTETVIQAGYLTSQKAYYLSRRSPNLVTPEPGLIPTASPAIYCPDPLSKIEIDFQMVALGKDNQAIDQHDYGRGVFEAILRQVNGGWMITSFKLIKWHGI